MKDICAKETMEEEFKQKKTCCEGEIAANVCLVNYIPPFAKYEENRMICVNPG